MVHMYRQKNDIKAEEFTRTLVWTDVYRVEYYYYYIPILQPSRVENKTLCRLC